MSAKSTKMTSNMHTRNLQDMTIATHLLAKKNKQKGHRNM